MPPSNPEKRWTSTGQQFLVRHTSGTYYARGYQGGKQVWQSLQTKRISVAKARLADWLQTHRQRAATVAATIEGKMTVGDAANLHLQAIAENARIKQTTRHYWHQIINALYKSWPGLKATDVRRVSAADCRAWAAKYASMISATRYNNSIAVLRHIFEHAVAAGTLSQNPALPLKRRTVRAKELDLPSRQEFVQFVASILTAGAWCSRSCGDLEFLQGRISR